MTGATHLALLRGINVGGKNKLPMKVLVEMFVEAGCKDVRTYIQSGNVIFNAPKRVSARISDEIAAQIAERLGYRTPMILRTAEQLRDVISRNPFLETGAELDTLFVMFLADMPNALHVEKLDPDRSPPDAFRVLGQEIYMHFPDGVAKSKPTNAYFDSKLATIGTSRNWRTVNKLLELMEGDR
jgi:uncharacterized protein (DUF1697 family)